MERADYWETVANQGHTLRQSIAAVRAGLPPEGMSLPADLPVGIAAMGASTYAAEVLVYEAQQRGRVVLNRAASEWHEVPWPPLSLLVGISESGRSPETIQALQQAPGPTLVLTNVPDAPVSTVASRTVSLGGIRDAGVYLSGYTSTVAGLALVGEALGLTQMASGLDQAPDAVEAVLVQAEAVVAEFLSLTPGGSGPTALDCVGGGGSWAAACETALILREAGRTPSAAFPTDQYLHGPAEGLTPTGGLVVFGSNRTDELVRWALGRGIPTLHVSPEPAADAVGLRLPRASATVTGIMEAVVGQVLAGRIGTQHGHELGTFQHEFAGTKLPVG
ncbi:MAG: SIS domain-containing protein [Propioniciclava sp.]